jgi:lipoate-protein ligase A
LDGVAHRVEKPFIDSMDGAVLLSDFAAGPWYNMAADEIMLALAAVDSSILYVRLYTWEPAAITFGYSQSREKAVDMNRLGDTPLIKRITGGRALFHDRAELTYAIAFNATGDFGSTLGNSISHTQAKLAEVLAEFLRAEGIESTYSKVLDSRERKRSFAQTAPCFASSGRYELTSERGKVAASAQRRIQGAVLQHGSIKIAGMDSHPALRLDARPFEESPPSPMDANSFQRRVGTFANSFTGATGIPITRMGYSEVEQELIQKWLETVRKKSVERRDIFKQGPLQLSL